MSNTTIITEKPSVARKIITAFSVGHKLKFNKTKGKSRYNPIYRVELPSKLEFSISKVNLQMSKGDVLTISSVLGHVLSYEYPSPYDKKSSWQNTNLLELLEMQPIEIPINRFIFDQLKDLGNQTDILVIGTDWDGHGESIGAQIVSSMTQSNSDIQIGRMRFTSTDVGTLLRAFQNQTDLDRSWITQVDSLRKQDLRMGASLTRFFTVGVQSQGVSNRLVSYGPCQTSVLWIIADRSREREKFISKPYWEIFVDVEDKTTKERLRFQWVEGKQFNRSIVEKVFAGIKNERQGKILNVTMKKEIVKRPLPLDTDNLEYDGSRFFRISPKNIADVAEQLYNQGFITYPRTESSYYHEKDLTKLLEKFLQNNPFNELAEKVKKEGNPRNPSKGRYTRDHEPIKPVRSAYSEDIKKAIRGSERDKELAWSVYDYVVRRFLATIHQDATKESTKMEILVRKEKFVRRGTRIGDPGFLQIFPFRRIREFSLPKGKVGDILQVDVSFQENETRPPALWTEYDLIREMASRNIGTDATRSSHIATVKFRRFAGYSGTQKGLLPTPLGQALYRILTETAEELIRPEIRATVEEWTQKIRSNEITPEEVDTKVIEITRHGLQAMMSSKAKIFENLAHAVKETTGEGELFGNCPECDSNLALRHSRKGKRFLACEDTECSTTFALPKKGKLSLLSYPCEMCGLYPIRVGSGTRTWVFCPRCWTALADEEGIFFCSRCSSKACPHAGKSDSISSQDRGMMGKCPECGSEVILSIDGFRTKVVCKNESGCGKSWNAPNIRKGTQIMIGEPCKTCGMKVLEVKRQGKSPYALCVVCGKFL